MLRRTHVLSKIQIIHHQVYTRERLGWTKRTVQMRRIVCYHFSHLSETQYSASITTCDMTSAAARLKALATASATCFPNRLGHCTISSSCTMESNFALNRGRICHRYGLLFLSNPQPIARLMMEALLTWMQWFFPRRPIEPHKPFIAERTS